MRVGWPLLVATSLASCGTKTITAADCQKLAEPHAMTRRCYQGDLVHGHYIGDLRCFPFSPPERMRGIWTVDLEDSSFHPNAIQFSPSMLRGSSTWLKLVDPPREIVVAMQGGGARAYKVELIGRRSLCPGFFGQMGIFPQEVIVDRFVSLRPISGVD